MIDILYYSSIEAKLFIQINVAMHFFLLAYHIIL